MKKVILFFCVVAVLFSMVSCGAPKRPETPKPVSETLTRDEYAVYRDIMSAEFEGRGTTIVKEKTFAPHNEAGINSEIRGKMEEEFGKQLKEGLVDGFIAVNLKPAMINQDILGFKGAKVLSAEAEKEVFPSDQTYYEDFRSRYPSPARMVEFSRVAFDGKMETAVAYFGKMFYDEKESVGYYVLLRKARGKWVIDKRITAWGK
ncbi:MAG: hypothetical protein PHH20_00615 [Candidatus Omnitrophica bacterium]|nr:hypothetical protein [Candidatus Omnitrophota bacterium]